MANERRATTGERTVGASDVPRAFTVVEVVIAVAIMAILAALTLPMAASYLSHKRIESTASTLTDLKNSIETFRATVGASPSRMTHLSRAIVTGTTVFDSTSCTGRALATPLTKYTATNVSAWPTGAPYYPKALSTTGLPLPIGTASDTLFRTAVSGTASYLQITIRSVRYEDARALNDLMDGTGDVDQVDRSNNSGVVQWGAPVSERVDVTYNVSIGRLC